MPTDRNRNTGGKKQKTKKKQGPINRKQKGPGSSGGGGSTSAASTSRTPSRAGSTRISTTGKARTKRKRSGGGYLTKK